MEAQVSRAYGRRNFKETMKEGVVMVAWSWSGLLQTAVKKMEAKLKDSLDDWPCPSTQALQKCVRSTKILLSPRSQNYWSKTIKKKKTTKELLKSNEAQHHKDTQNLSIRSEMFFTHKTFFLNLKRLSMSFSSHACIHLCNTILVFTLNFVIHHHHLHTNTVSESVLRIRRSQLDLGLLHLTVTPQKERKREERERGRERAVSSAGSLDICFVL